MEHYYGHQHSYFVSLDEETYSRWNNFKTAEGITTDTDAANTLIREYGKVQRCEVQQPLACCIECNSELPDLCRKCQPEPTIAAGSLPAGEDTPENRTPVIYRVLHISADENGQGQGDNNSAAPIPASRNRKKSKSCMSVDDKHLVLAKAKELAGSGKTIIIIDYISKSKHDSHDMCSEDAIFTAVQQSDGFAGNNCVRVSLNATTARGMNPLVHAATSCESTSRYIHKGVRQGQTAHRQTAEPQNSQNYLNPAPNPAYYGQRNTSQINQISNAATVLSGDEDGGDWMEQLIYGEPAAQTVHRSTNAEANSAAPALSSTAAVEEASMLALPAGMPSSVPTTHETTSLVSTSDIPQGVPSITYLTLKGKPRKTRNGKPIPTSRIRTCKVCGKVFFSPSNLQIHMRTHTGEKPYSCDECDASFRQRGSLKAHKLEVHGCKNHLCPQCGVRFALPEDLQRHMRFHSSDRRYNCQLCKFSGKTADSLRKHMKIHKSGRAFQCTECGIQFSTQRKLTSHSQTHVGGQVFRCNQCEATFPDRKSLKDHKEWHLLQSQSVQFQCTVCGILFINEKKLNAHLSQNHAGEAVFKCYQCEATFSDRKSLKYHKDWHRLQAKTNVSTQSRSHVQSQSRSSEQSQLRSSQPLQSLRSMQTRSQAQFSAQSQLHCNVQSQPQTAAQSQSSAHSHSSMQLQPSAQPQSSVHSHTTVPSQVQYSMPPPQSHYSVVSHAQSQYTVL